MRTVGLSLLLALSLSGVAGAIPFLARAHWAESADVGVMVLGPTSLAVVRMDGTALGKVSTDEPVSLVELTRDGGRIAYATSATVHVIRPDGTEAASLPAKSCMMLHWAADGSKLLYTSLEDGATAGQKRLIVYVVDPDGQNRREILSQSYASP